MFLFTKYQYYIYIFSPFSPLHIGAAISVLAISTPAIWCRVFRSRLFSRPASAIDTMEAE